MSGGRPSSIKRIVLCAAASLHIYVPEFLLYFAFIPDQGDVSKKKIISFWLRLVRDFSDALLYGTFLGGLWFYVLSAALIISHESRRLTFTAAAAAFLAFQITSVVVCGAFLSFIKRRPLHKYDPDIIGKNFTGMSKSSRAFRKGVKSMHEADFRMALEIFTDLEASAEDLSESEKGVLAFYRGRCYHILGAYPNAVMCYEKASDAGFSIPIMPLFTARCLAENGRTERALDIYKELLGSDNECKELIRTEIGNMYLKLNDGKNALKWFQEAIDLRENYAAALGGAAIANVLLRNFKEGEELYRSALLNHIEDSVSYTRYYKEIQAAVMLETKFPSVSTGGDK